MAGLSTGLKKKLSITPCQVDAHGTITIDSSKKAFEVMLNPSAYSHTYTIEYNTHKTFGQLGAESKFSAIQPEKVGFAIVIDGTGVVDLPLLGGSPDVKTQIRNLENVAYTYNGSRHEPNHVRLLWGSLIFFGRLESMSVAYTLFKPSGEPLRAKVTLSFVGFISKEEEALKANRSSPDLTHVVVVKAGETLPLLCHRIYRDSSYYLAVAKANNLVNFRELTPGLRLRFPPLR